MELRSYQIHVMDDIGAYLDALDTSKGLHAAWKKYWDAKGVAVNPLDGTEAVPPVGNRPYVRPIVLFQAQSKSKANIWMARTVRQNSISARHGPTRLAQTASISWYLKKKALASRVLSRSTSF